VSQVLIAIVDDDETVRDATKQLVQSLDYNASAFGSADEFLKSEQVHDTSCLITDVQMPGLNGIDLQDRLIARGHRIPIIFMTGYPDDSVRWGSHDLALNSPVTSVTGLESPLLAVFACLAYSRKNQRSAFSDFCNTIGQKQTSRWLPDCEIVEVHQWIEFAPAI
jgi:DNA-binding NtrC family response regulator